jgi:hypothetical protein
MTVNANLYFLCNVLLKTTDYDYPSAAYYIGGIISPRNGYTIKLRTVYGTVTVQYTETVCVRSPQYES